MMLGLPPLHGWISWPPSQIWELGPNSESTCWEVGLGFGSGSSGDAKEGGGGQFKRRNASRVIQSRVGSGRQIET